MTEEWRDIPSLPEYEASSLGRVRCKPYSSPMPNGGSRIYAGKAIKGVWHGTRYILHHNKTGKNHKVARLVCEAFNGPPPFPGAVCEHRDEDSRNNLPGNLRWTTQRQNMNAPKLKARIKGRGLIPPKLSIDNAREVLRSSESAASLARRFGVSACLISNIRAGRAWRAAHE